MCTLDYRVCVSYVHHLQVYQDGGFDNVLPTAASGGAHSPI